MTQEELTGGVTATFNGVDLTKWLRISDVVRNVGQNRQTQLIDIGKAAGRYFQYTKVNEGTVVIKGDANYDLTQTRRDLAAALMTDEPAQLIFDDEPDKYYLAIVEGQSAFEEDQFHGELTVTFTVPDGVAYAVTPVTVHTTAGTPIKVPYHGTAPAMPVVTFTMPGNNGYVGVANDNGDAVEFGDPESVDGVELTKSDRALRSTFRTEPTGVSFNTGCVTQYVNNVGSHQPNLFTGTVAFGYNSDGEKSADGENTHQTYGSGAKVWHGPGMHFPIALNSNGVATGDLLMKSRFYFQPTSKAYGRMEWTLESGGKAIVSAIIRDSTKGNTRKTFEYMVNGKSMKTVNLDTKKFAGGFMEVQIARKGAGLMIKVSSIKKLTGDTVSSTYGTYTVNTTIADFDTVPIDGLTTCAWQYDTGSAVTMYWTDLKFDWVNVDYWSDIPNQWEAGDEVTLDMPNRTVLVNGVEEDLMTVGNEWDGFAMDAPMTIQPVVSSWAAPGDVTISVREAFK